MPDGGRNAARDLRYQYLRTLEAFMGAVEEPGDGVRAIHIEGRPGAEGADADSIDYGLSDASGQIVSAVQVNTRAPGSAMGAGQIFGILAALVLERNATRYELRTNARAGDSATGLMAALSSGGKPSALRIAIDMVLASVSAERRRDELSRLGDEHLARLSRARVEFDPRDDAEISEGLSSRLRRYRDCSSSS